MVDDKEVVRRAIICGGRDFEEDDHYNIRDKLIGLLKKLDITEEVCGCALGADVFGCRIAMSIGFKVKYFPADWKAKDERYKDDPIYMVRNQFGNYYNSLAGFNRNKRMSEYVKGCAICIALPGGKGTKNMIRHAKKNNIPVYIWNDFEMDFIKDGE